MSAASIGCAAAAGTYGFGWRRRANHDEIARAEQQPDRFDDIRLIVSDQHAEGCRRTQPANRLGGGTFSYGQLQLAS